MKKFYKVCDKCLQERELKEFGLNRRSCNTCRLKLETRKRTKQKISPASTRLAKRPEKASCHPTRFLFAKTRCRACYYKNYRVNQIINEIRSRQIERA